MSALTNKKTKNFYMTNLDNKIEVLKLIIRSNAQKAFQNCTSFSDSKIEDVEVEDDLIYGQYMALILINGRDIKASLKIHYFENTAFLLLPKDSGELSNLKNTRQNADDFMKEFANLSAGYIISELEKNHISANASLPIVSNGFDEVYSTDITHTSEIKDWWKINFESGTLNFSSITEFRDLATLEKLELLDKNMDSNNQEGLRFL
jgi:CheY-specific phosphatase CheX